MTQPAQITEEQKKKLAELFNKLGQPQQKPIIKSLESMGIQIRVMEIAIDYIPEQCLVVPLSELMAKEYRLMSGVDISQYTTKENEDERQSITEMVGPGDVQRPANRHIEGSTSNSSELQ